MKSLANIVLIATSIAITASELQPISTSAVGLIGGVIKSRHSVDADAKYPRKDCPVCKGNGWYVSGDKITKVDCGYCIDNSKETSQEEPVILPEAVEPAPPPTPEPVSQSVPQPTQKQTQRTRTPILRILR